MYVHEYDTYGTYDVYRCTWYIDVVTGVQMYHSDLTELVLGIYVVFSGEAFFSRSFGGCGYRLA